MPTPTNLHLRARLDEINATDVLKEDELKYQARLIKARFLKRKVTIT